MRVLVAFASKHGSTAEIAQAISDRLRQSGLTVDCRDVGEVTSLVPYGAVVLGSAVYMGRWRRDARRFLRRHGAALAERRLWIFSSGPTGPPADDKPGWTEPRGTVHHAQQLGALDHVVFGGRVPSEGNGPAARAMREGTPSEYRDRRDWVAIRGWADGIASQLRAVAPGA